MAMESSTEQPARLMGFTVASFVELSTRYPVSAGEAGLATCIAMIATAVFR